MARHLNEDFLGTTYVYWSVIAPKLEFSFLSFEKSQLGGSSSRFKLPSRFVHETRSHFARTDASTKICILCDVMTKGEDEENHGGATRFETKHDIYSYHTLVFDLTLISM